MNTFKTFLLSLCTIAAASVCGFAAEQADAAALDRDFEAAARIEYGYDPAQFKAIDDAVPRAVNNPDLRLRLEQGFTKLLTGTTTTAAKDYACRNLALVGSEQAVPALAALLGDAATSSLARVALEQIPGKAPAAALRQALPAVPDPLKLGVISSLQALRDPDAVALLAGLLARNDAVGASAAIALGGIGTEQAAQTLLRAHEAAPGDRKEALGSACIIVADRLAVAGRHAAASRVYESVLQEHSTGYLHLAAFQGLVLHSPPGSVRKRLIEFLTSDDEMKRNIAAQLVAARFDASGVESLLRGQALEPRGMTAVVRALQSQSDSRLRPVVLPLLRSQNVEVRAAVLDLLGTIGTAEDVLPLAALAANRSGPEREAARKALSTLRSEGVEEAIQRGLQQDIAPAEIVELLRAVQQRGIKAASSEIARLLSSSTEPVRRAALDALAAVGTEAEVAALVVQLKSGGPEQSRISNALEQIAGRAHARVEAPLLKGYADAAPPEKALLLRVLSVLGTDAALDTARAAQRAPELNDAAVRALANWPSQAAAPDLLKIMESGEGTHRTLAFRGYVRIARETEAEPKAKFEMLSRAFQLARGAQDQTLVLGALGDVKTLDALNLSLAQLGNAEIVDEAGSAVVRIAIGISAEHKAAAVQAIEKVIQSAKAEPVLDEARRELRRIQSGRR